MSRTLQPQDQISHYRVVGPLGTGGMGEVYIAKDESLERSVALKVLPPRLVKNEERVRRFVTEAKSASSLNHPNIVTIYEIGQDRVRGSDAGDGAPAAADPVHFISMELVAGETLNQKIHEEKAELKTILGYLAQAADGIAKAHTAGIIHRDLKPGNIMVSKDGFAKVLDFGLAKLTEKQAAPDLDQASAPTEGVATGEGVVMGTAGYMSPEQVQGKTVDHRSDIFSMGCIIYEAAARRRPFVADTDIEVMHQILRDRPTPVEELNPAVPAEVRRIIRRCLAKSPDQRFQSMKDVAIELREVVDEYDSLSISGTAPMAASSLPSGALGATQRRRSGAIAGLVAVGLLGVAGLAFGLYGLIGRAAPADGAGQGLQDLRISVLMNRDDLNEAVLSSDGRYLAFVTAANGMTSLNVRQVRTGSDVVILPPQEYPIHGVRFSPDGDYIYYLNQDPSSPAYNALFQVASLGGAPRKILFDIDSTAGFSPDGTRLCFRRGMPDKKADALMIAELESRKERELLRIDFPERFVAPPVWSPDGTRIAAAIQTPLGGFRTSVTVIDVESGRKEDFGPKNFTFVGDLGWLPDGKSILLSAFVLGTPAPQIYRVSYPSGDVRRLTNDLNGYAGLSLSADGRSVAAIRSTDVSNLWVARLDGAQEPHAITFATGSSGSAKGAVTLPDGGIVFEGSEGEKVQLWRAEADGSNRKRLTAQGLLVFGAQFAERAGIVFSKIEDDVVGHVWRMDPDGGGLRQLTSGKGEQLSDLSRDGKTILFTKWEDPQRVWVMDAISGGEPRPLASEATGRPRISWDGKLVRYGKFIDMQGRLYEQQLVIPVEGGAPVAEFLLPPGAVASDWSPDGKSFTYLDRNQGWNLMQQSIRGGEPSQLTHFREGRTTDFQWSPDGSKLALVRRIGPKDGLWVFEPRKGEPRLLTEFRTGTIREIRWTPDGKSVVFAYGTASQDVVLISDFQ